MSNIEGLALVRRVSGRRKLGTGLVIAGLIALIAEAAQFLPGDPTDDSLGRRVVIGAVAAICLASGLACLHLWRLPKGPRNRQALMVEAERSQSKRQMAFLLMPLSLALQLPGVIEAVSHLMKGQGVEHLELSILGIFVFFLLAFALLIGGALIDRWCQPVLDDELSRELRRRAVFFGYALLVPGMAIVFLLQLIDRTLAAELTPVVAAIGVGGPALRMFLLERAAGRELGPE